MFSRLTQKDTLPDPIDSLIADAELKLHEAEIGTEEYTEITQTILKLQRIKESRKADADRARLALAGEIIGGLAALVFTVKPELAAKYSKIYWNWKLSRMFGYWL